MKPLKVAISTVGCRANQADSATIARYLDSRCVAVSSTFEGADIAVVNTCCVTAEAERDSRKLSRRALAASPDALVVLVGCAVNAVAGFGNNIDPRIVKKRGPEAEPRALAAWINRQAGAPDPGEEAPHLTGQFTGRTRALLRIQTGCSHGCAYCIVPRARGPERSLTPEAVLAEVEALAGVGFKEVVLTGVQLGAWGKDLPNGPRLSALAVQVADRFSPGRVRLSSVEPWSVDDALIDAVAGHDRICPHLHLPLQSGDDRILGAMGRGYRAREYLGIVDRIRRAMPDAAIGTDVLLGFPGEDDQAFQNTLAALRALNPAYLHAFSFSPRPHTRAATLPGRTGRETVRKRNRAVRRLGEERAEAYRRRHLGQRREIIVEAQTPDGARGVTDTFVKARFTNGRPEPGELVWAEIEAAGPDGLEVALRSFSFQRSIVD